jgi:hypothetical protein
VPAVGKTKPLTDYPLDRKGLDRRRGVCRSCRQAGVRERRAERSRARAGGRDEEPEPAPRRRARSRDEERRRYLDEWVEAGVVERRDGEYVIVEEWRATVAQAFAGFEA